MRRVKKVEDLSCSEGKYSRRTPESVAILLSGMDLVGTGMIAPKDRSTAESPDQLNGTVLRPSAPQWFDEEGSDEGDGSTEIVGLPRDDTDRESDQCELTRTDAAVPQWFVEDSENEEVADVELPLDDTSDFLGLASLLGAGDADHIAEADSASDYGSTSTGDRQPQI
ncbi:uncharacterized protein IUM83_06207 [Phytophthora cinnamomi]|uniref:uncharacterized protein n=1 Tax=Phytophthora cinnamomi TaxID=4785 RepID=UPI00355A03D0|nr:hypothetical protein IUM83_06207 [Phytophthora cinnamomi]